MTMSSRPRVLTEQDAGSMDTLIRRGEQAATAAEQTTQQLQGAAADLEQVKGTIPAAAQSAAALATAQAKATLDAATLNATTAASQATLALATLPKFRSVDVNNPTAPTQAELDANPGGLGGTRLTADGATQPLRWTPHTLAGAWVTVGAPTATTPQVQEARALAQEADGRAVEAQALAAQADSKADSASNLAEGATTRLTGVTNQAEVGPPPAGPAGIPETPRNTLTMTATLRGERVTYGIGANAALQSLSNQPGNRTQVTAVGTMPEIGTYGGVDHVTRFAEMVADPGTYSVPTGAGTYTATTVTASGLPMSLLLDSDGQPRAGMIIGTAHNPAWYGSLVSVSGNTITVNGWWRIGSGTSGTPADGTPALVNLMSKGWVDNCNLIIPTGAPISDGVIAEWGLMNNNADSAGFNGLDIVSLGSKRVGTAVVLRAKSSAAAFAQGVAVQGVSTIGVSIEKLNGVSPIREYQAAADSQVAFYSQGTKGYHARFMGPDGTTEHFSVDGTGNVQAAGSVQVGNVLEVMSGAIDLHTPGDGDYTVRLTMDATKTLYLIPAGGPAQPIGTRAAALTAPVPTAAAGSTPTKAEFDAVVARLADLEAKMRASGLLT